MTDLETIYKKFYRRCDSISLLSYDKEYRDNVTQDCLDEAIVQLTPYLEDDISLEINEEESSFKTDLDKQIQYFLTELMFLSFIKRCRDREENTFNTLGTKDYTIYSPANLLNSLVTLVNTVSQEVFTDLNNYSTSSLKQKDLEEAIHG